MSKYFCVKLIEKKKTCNTNSNSYHDCLCTVFQAWCQVLKYMIPFNRTLANSTMQWRYLLRLQIWKLRIKNLLGF